jgi:SAM-dependent methyltransferase
MEIEGRDMDDLSFARYLASKRSVDDRALNRLVWQALEERLAALEGRPLLHVLELGGGIGTMFQRMIQWGLLDRVEYTMIDELDDNIRTARSQIVSWGGKQGFQVNELGAGIQLTRADNYFNFRPLQGDLFDFLGQSGGQRWDLLVANAVLDLLDVRAVLPLLRAALRPGGLMYLTINFDGLTALEPVIERELDDRVIELYHRTMDERLTGGVPSGDSRTGRHLFSWLNQNGLRILEAGSSDWAVYPRSGTYEADEAYFLRFILHYFEESLSGCDDLEPGDLARWLAARRRQIEQGELVLIVHQFDFLVAVE